MRPRAASASRCATPKRCCSSMTTRSSRANETEAWSRACVPTTTWAWPVASASVVERRAAGATEPVSRVTAMPASASISETVRASCRASRSVGASSAAWAPARAAIAERVRRDGGLARADVALDEPEHRRIGREVGPHVAHRPGLVLGQVHVPTETPRQGRADRRPQRRLVLVADRQSVRALAASLAPARGHADLEREQLVVREPLACCFELGGVGREVGGFDRVAGRWPRPLDIGRQVLLVRSIAVEGGTHGGPQLARRDALRQPIHRHDPPRVDELRPVVGLELGVLEDDLPAALADLAARDDERPLRQALLDEAAPEPDRLRLVALLVAKERGRALDAAAERLLDAEGRDLGAHGRWRAVGHRAQVGHGADLAQVVIPPRQVRQELAHRDDAEPRPVAAERGGARQLRAPDRRIERVTRR